MTTIPCYLRTLRREWGLTQEELAGLVSRSNRERVSDIERAKAQPNAAEILAYSVLFGLPPAEIFPAFYETIEEQLIQGAYALDEALKTEGSLRALRVQALLQAALARATKRAHNPVRP